MKHVYPVRHPASLDAAAQGSATAGAGETSLPREQAGSGDKPARDADKAPAMDKDDAKIGPDRPRR